MKESVLNTRALATSISSKATATTTPNDPTPITHLGSAIGTGNRSGYYRNVPDPMAYDVIQTADGRRIRVESHVIGRDC